MTLYAHTTPTFIGDYTLRVKDLDVMSQYYQSVIGLTLINSTPSQHILGIDSIPLLTLNHSPQIKLASRNETGLFHAAYLVPTRKDLANFAKHLTENHVPYGASDHLVSEALYLQDPEDNGIEVYVDRPYKEWPFDKDGVVMDTLPLNLDKLLSLADNKKHKKIAIGTRIGHIHLKVDNLKTALSFYKTQLNQEIQETYPGAFFLATGAYHHHIAINTWMSSRLTKTDNSTTGLERFSIFVKDEILFKKITQAPQAEAFSKTTVKIPTKWGYDIFLRLIK